MNTQEARKLIEEALAPSFRAPTTTEIDLANALSEALEDVETLGNVDWLANAIRRFRKPDMGAGSLAEQIIDAARVKP